mmetsp:Transcript_8216/g.27608  ORF Transcript_8216/g.27608 Transcript_8216/m.27608 type:complete len:208 (-) Transcript_8216:130-753(-)
MHTSLGWTGLAAPQALPPPCTEGPGGTQASSSELPLPSLSPPGCLALFARVSSLPRSGLPCCDHRPACLSDPLPARAPWTLPLYAPCFLFSSHFNDPWPRRSLIEFPLSYLTGMLATSWFRGAWRLLAVQLGLSDARPVADVVSLVLCTSARIMPMTSHACCNDRHAELAQSGSGAFVPCFHPLLQTSNIRTISQSLFSPPRHLTTP